MLVLARLLEAGGLSTMLVTMMHSWAEQHGVPRAVAVEFPFAHPLGLPGRPDMQLAVLRDALQVLAEAEAPNTVVHLEREWPGDEAEWRRRWQPASISPLIARHLDDIRALRPSRQ